MTELENLKLFQVAILKKRVLKYRSCST